LIDYRNSPDLIFLYRSNGAGQFIIFTTDNDRVRHHIAHYCSIGISRLSYYFYRQVSISDYSNYFFGSFVADNWYGPNVFAPHNSRGLTNQIVR